MGNNTIYVLGNGASMGSKREPKHFLSRYKMPSSKNFFLDTFYTPKTKRAPEHYLNMLGMTYEGTSDFLIRAWGIKRKLKGLDVEDWENINIEDVVTFLDVGEKMFSRGSNYYHAFQKSKSYLVKFIVLMIWFRSLDQKCEYLEKIFRKINPTDTIISFNWDTLADFTLDHLRSIQLDNYLKIMSNDAINTGEYKKKGIFLKLHGYVNWVVCNNRKCINYKKIKIPQSKKRQKLEVPLNKFDRCSHCNSRLEHFIIPPVSNKMIIHKNSLVHNLWMLAREKLAGASKIIFIGYSFPSTDFYVEWLFRQVYFLVDDKRIDFKHEIVVINPDMYKKDSETLRRYKTIFRDYKITTFRTLRSYAKFISHFEK